MFPFNSLLFNSTLSSSNHARQVLRPSCSAAASKSLPMKTILLLRASPSPHVFPGDPSNTACTPCSRSHTYTWFALHSSGMSCIAYVCLLLDSVASIPVITMQPCSPCPYGQKIAFQPQNCAVAKVAVSHSVTCRAYLENEAVRPSRNGENALEAVQVLKGAHQQALHPVIHLRCDTQRYYTIRSSQT